MTLKQRPATQTVPEKMNAKVGWRKAFMLAAQKQLRRRFG